MAYPLGAPRNNSDTDADPAKAGIIPGPVSAITDDARPRATLSYNDNARPGPAHVDVARAGPAHVDDAMPAPAHIEDARPGPAHVDVTWQVLLMLKMPDRYLLILMMPDQVLLILTTPGWVMLSRLMTPDRVLPMLTMTTPSQLITHDVVVTSGAQWFIICQTHRVTAIMLNQMTDGGDAFAAVNHLQNFYVRTNCATRDS